MEDHEDETLPSSSFATHLQKFNYTPTSKATKCLAPAVPVRSTSKTAQPLIKYDPDQTRSQKSKRKLDVEPQSSIPSSTPSKRRTTTKERSAHDPYEPENKLFDSLRTGLTLVFIGLNPGLETARTGHAYAHATNQFWPLLHSSGITTVRHKPADTYLMPELYNIGNTNLCERATRAGDGLSRQEQADGAKTIEQKIAKYKPEAVCIVGKGIWDTVYKSKTGKTLPRQDFKYGWQDERLWLGRVVDEKGKVVSAGARTFVCTSTSGLAADTKPAEKLAIMSELGNWIKKRRQQV
jgi:mismatch-specific thymine-DNA glycosylase